MPTDLKFTLHDDGSFDAEAAGIRVANAWPGIDGTLVRAMRTRVTRSGGAGRIRYDLAQRRSITLTFRRKSGSLRIGTTLAGFETAPHWVSPVFDAAIEGATGLFRTGIGFSGPTNFVEFATQPAEYSFDSYLVTGLCDAGGATVALGAFEHADFLAKAHVSNRVYRHNFRNREIERNLPRIELLFATENISPHKTRLDLPEIVLTGGDDAWTTLRGWTERLARERCIKPRLDPRYHFCSWYERGPNFGQADLDRLLAGLAKRPEPLGCIQIDAGYCPSLGDWLIPRTDVWPQGIEHALRSIRAAGCAPGIWVAPFMVGSRSRVAIEHPEWLLHDLDGKRIPKWKRYDGGGIPGHADEETYILDTSHPDALDYVENCFRTLHGWGARFFKTDFIEWGFVDSTKVHRFRPGKTSAQYYHEAMTRIRTAIGDSYWLGCIAYFAPMIGLCDGIRVSSDVGVKWDGDGGTGNDGVGGGTQNAVEETHGCQFFNNVLWQNDPDVTFFRDKHIELSQAEIESLAYWNAILGVSINTSCQTPFLSARRHRLWRFVRPQEKPFTGEIVNWPKRGPLVVATREYPDLRSHALLLFNTSNRPLRDWVRLADVVPHAPTTLFSWGPGVAKPLGRKREILVDLAPHESRLFYVSASRKPPPRELTLGGRM